MTNFYIDDIQIKSPPIPMRIEKYTITKAGRTADATMQMELIARKRKFILSYPVMTHREKKIIEDIIWDNTKMFFEFKYTEDFVEKTATVYAGDLIWTPARNGGIIYYKDCAVHLIER